MDDDWLRLRGWHFRELGRWLVGARADHPAGVAGLKWLIPPVLDNRCPPSEWSEYE